MAHAVRPLPDVPALAASMERLHKRCAEVESKRAASLIDRKLMDAGALNPGERIDLGSGEILEQTQGSGMVPRGAHNPERSGSIPAPATDPTGQATVSAETTDRRAGEDEASLATASPETRQIPARPEGPPPEVLKWQKPIDEARRSVCGRYAVCRVVVNGKRHYELWHLVPSGNWFHQIGPQFESFESAARLANEHVSKR